MAAKKSLKKVAAKLKAKATQARAQVKAKASSARASATKVTAKAKAASTGLSYAPKGIRSITPNLMVSDAAAAIEFYKRAFNATEVSRMPSPDGKQIWHAEIRIGDSSIFINDAMMGAQPSTLDRPSPTSLMIYVKDCDKVFNQAVSAGAKVTLPMGDQFWGDRMGNLMDPYGNPWAVATKVKDLTPRQLREAGEEFARQMAQMGGEMPPAQPSSSPAGGARA